MPDEPKLDVDPLIPTGVEASPEQVAELVLDGVVPAAAIPKLADVQRPDPDDLDRVLARRPELKKAGTKLAALKSRLRDRRGQTETT